MKSFMLLFISLLFLGFLGYSQCTLKINSNNYAKPLSSTGNKLLDQSILDEGKMLEDYFNVDVDFNVCSGSNAFAINNCQNKTSCDGTIELGKNLILDYFNKNAFGVNQGGRWMVIAIMAHEVAHIIQYTRPDIKFKNSVQQEIHADILAGWYIAMYLDKIMPNSDRYRPWTDSHQAHNDIKLGLMQAFGFMGDSEYGSQYHHGNYLTRVMAMHHGMDQYERGSNVWTWQDIFLRFGVGDAQYIIDKWNHRGNHTRN